MQLLKFQNCTLLNNTNGLEANIKLWINVKSSFKSCI